MSDTVHIRFYAGLNDFLPPAQRNAEFEHELKKDRSVKDLIESIGVPHTEVDVIVVNGHSVDFDYLVQGGEQIHVYPRSSDVNVSPLIHNQPMQPAEPRFVIDVHLGRLARYLRMLGFDALYRNDYEDAMLAEISDDEQRILLTCDLRLLMRKRVQHGYFVRSRKPREQVLEVLKRYDLFDYRPEAERCIVCNGIIHPVNKQDIEARLLPLTKKYYHEFLQCDSCGKIYWEGSHHAKMQRLIERIRSA